MKSVVILNSRQNLRPVGSDLWIKNANMAIQKLIGQDVVILTSVGMKTWEYLIFLAAKYKVKQRIYGPVTRDQKNIDVVEYYTKQFQLDPELTDYYFLEIEDLVKDNLFFQKERDRLIVNDADIIYPISIRKDSTLKLLYEKTDKSQVVVSEQYMVKYIKNKQSYKYGIDKTKLNPKMDTLLEDYLIHWTRAINETWPDEYLYDYYQSIINSQSKYSHSAYHTLIRILSEKKLRVSSRHYRQGISAVAFSELQPSEAIDLMKWRARYNEMSFEPYGIAIRKKIAEKIGIKKVIYGDSKNFNSLHETDKPYFQSIGTKGYWAPEKEWRYIGEIDLSKINPKNLRVIVWKKEQVDSINKYSKSRIISLYN